MKKLLLTIFIISGSLIPVLAQHLTPNNLYLHNRFIFNPARAGYYYGIDGFVNTRYQWQGIEGAPRLISFGVSAPINEKMGLGVKIHNDKKGVFESTFAETAYAYQVQLGEYNILTFGLSAGIVDRQLNQVNIAYPNDFDPIFQKDGFDETLFTVGAGIGYQLKNLKMDLAFPYLLEEGDALREHFLLLASYDWFLPINAMKITPSIMYRNLVYSDSQVDFNLEINFKDLLWIRPGYRTTDNMILAAGVNFNSIRLGYGFQQTNLQFAEFAHNSHELSVGFTINTRSQKGKVPVSRSIDPKVVDGMSERMRRIEEKMEGQEFILNRNYDLITDQQRMLNSYGRKMNRLDSMMIDVGEIRGEDMDGAFVERVKPGYYVIISTFESEERARRAISMLKQNEIYSRIMHDPAKGFYYIYSSRSTDREDALYNMRQLRQSNLKETWVLVVR